MAKEQKGNQSNKISKPDQTKQGFGRKPPSSDLGNIQNQGHGRTRRTGKDEGSTKG